MFTSVLHPWLSISSISTTPKRTPFSKVRFGRSAWVWWCQKLGCSWLCLSANESSPELEIQNMYCRYVVYDIYNIYLYGVCSYTCIHIFDYAQVYIYIQYRERGRMYDIYKSRKKSWAPKIMVPHLCWRRVWWYVNGASCKLPLVCLVE